MVPRSRACSLGMTWSHETHRLAQWKHADSVTGVRHLRPAYAASAAMACSQQLHPNGIATLMLLKAAQRMHSALQQQRSYAEDGLLTW
jgi:hypothetical protein